MNSVKSQMQNQHRKISCTLTTKYLKRTEENPFTIVTNQQIPEINLTICERSSSLKTNFDEGNWGRHKQMGRHMKCVQEPEKYCLNIYIPQSHQYTFNAIPTKIPMPFFIDRENNSKICIESQRPWIAQAILRKNKNWRYHTSLFQSITQSYNNPKQQEIGKNISQRSVEMNREPVNKPLHMHSTSILQGSQEYSVEEKQSLQQKVLGKLDNHMPKNDTGTPILVLTN